MTGWYPEVEAWSGSGAADFLARGAGLAGASQLNASATAGPNLQPLVDWILGPLPDFMELPELPPIESTEPDWPEFLPRGPEAEACATTEQMAQIDNLPSLLDVDPDEILGKPTAEPEGSQEAGSTVDQGFSFSSLLESSAVDFLATSNNEVGQRTGPADLLAPTTAELDGDPVTAPVTNHEASQFLDWLHDEWLDRVDGPSVDI